MEGIRASNVIFLTVLTNPRVLALIVVTEARALVVKSCLLKARICIQFFVPLGAGFGSTVTHMEPTYRMV